MGGFDMHRALALRAAAVAFVLFVAASDAFAQSGGVRTASAFRQPQFSLEGAAGVQLGYDGGSLQSASFGFAPTRSLTLLLSAERTHIPTKVRSYEHVWSAERGGTVQFVSAEVRYAFLAGRRISPFVLGGMGRGLSRPNVNEYFPDRVEREIGVVYYGGGVRIPLGTRFDALVDARFTATGDEGIFMPLRAGVAWRF
jgi:hypothetical protein